MHNKGMVIFSENLPVMFALCLMLLHTHYAHYNAGIICTHLPDREQSETFRTELLTGDHIQYGILPSDPVTWKRVYFV